MTLVEQAKAIYTDVADLVASPAAALVPARVRELLRVQASFLVILAAQLETLERKNNGNGDRKD